MLVIGFGEAGDRHLKLRRMFTAEGAKVQDKSMTELLPDEHHQIVGEIDPITRGLDITAYLD